MNRDPIPRRFQRLLPVAPDGWQYMKLSGYWYGCPAELVALPHWWHRLDIDVRFRLNHPIGHIHRFGGR